MSQENNQGTLYMVALPIGNIDDLTPRARNTLSEVDIIACEDTRKFKSLAQRCSLNYRARLLAYHDHNERESAPELIRMLAQGTNIAVVSDAGTPKVSDPGYHLVKQCFASEGSLSGRCSIVAIPGASAVTTLLSILPFSGEPFSFIGFLPQKVGKREKMLSSHEASNCIIFYESVHRITKSLKWLSEKYENRQVFIGRELTKTHEELFYGSLADAVEWSKDKKGEFVVALSFA